MTKEFIKKHNKSKHTICMLFIVTFPLLLQINAYSDSLWNKRAFKNTNLYVDNRARNVGDVVTVIIQEQTDILGIEDNELDADTKFTSNIDASDFFVGRTRKEKGEESSFNNSLPNISGNHKLSFGAEGEYESSRDINFRLTAIVTEVLANGNLLIEGKRGVSVNKEKYTLQVSGIIRPIDVDQDNVVLSEKMANADITLSGKGFLTRNAKRGWGYRVFDVLWPF